MERTGICPPKGHGADRVRGGGHRPGSPPSNRCWSPSFMSALARLSAALRSDAVSGSLLIGAAIVAVGWANSPLSGSYDALRSFTFGPAAVHLRLPVATWAADGLLAVFFFIVGNELKQELVHGELRDPRRAMLPVAAALGGVVVPALVFLAVNAAASGDAAAGWGIPMATDIAFALAVLAVAGRT